MKKIRANCGKIEELEVIKETEKQIVFISNNGKETREAKKSDSSSWHDTRQEAIDYLVQKQQNKIDFYLMNIERVKKEIERILKQA